MEKSYTDYIMITNPLEQFQLTTLIPVKLGGMNISFTNSSLFMLVILVLITAFYLFPTSEGYIVPRPWESIAENFFYFIRAELLNHLGHRGRKYMAYLFVLFNFIFFSNLIGMIPYSFTVTSHFIVAFTLSGSLFILLLGILIKTHKLKAFNTLVPPNSPGFLLPLLVPIELISFCSKPFSLAIRLFANMVAGHTLLKILAGFSWTMLSIGGIFYILQLFPLVVVFAVTGLEFVIAFLQAYVFFVLACMYIKDSIVNH